MTYSLSNNCTKNYYNRTLTVQVIVEDVVTWIFLRHSVVLCQRQHYQEVGDRCMCYHAEIGRSALKDVGRRTPKIGKRWNSALLRLQAWLTIFKDARRISLTCCHVKFGSSPTKDVRIGLNRMEPQNWGSLGPSPLRWGVADP